ncbi:MAG: hypothetical protein M1312_01770 [Patescibacteria group bacterium]|nr:hypothetical protein [Patescibacteria group bacterium]
MFKKKEALTVILVVAVGLLAIATILLILREPKPTPKPAPLPINEEPFHGPTYPPTTTGPFTPPPAK